MRFIDLNLDRWHTAAAEDDLMPAQMPRATALLTLQQWHAVRATWPHDLRVGLTLPNTADVESLRADLPRVALIALQFPQWTDGRAYSQARLLRARLRYAGELRATGEVLVDMLPLLQRTGFDAVLLRADQNLDVARRALRFFADHYQGDVRQTRPLFARRTA